MCWADVLKGLVLTRVKVSAGREQGQQGKGGGGRQCAWLQGSSMQQRNICGDTGTARGFRANVLVK